MLAAAPVHAAGVQEELRQGPAGGRAFSQRPHNSLMRAFGAGFDKVATFLRCYCVCV